MFGVITSSVLELRAPRIGYDYRTCVVYIMNDQSKDRELLLEVVGQLPDHQVLIATRFDEQHTRFNAE